MPLLDPLSQIASRLKTDRVIQDVVPEDFIPSLLFTITWSVEGMTKEVMLGTELFKEDIQNEPDVEITPMGGEDGAPTYTLAMFDPDAPSRNDPKYGPFRHWVVSGLKPPTPSQVFSAAETTPDLAETSPNPLSAMSTREVTTLTPYRPPNPDAGTGVHTYVFLLFEEPNGGLKLARGAPEYGESLDERRNWFPMEFARRNGLTLVGANYFDLASQ